MRQGAGEEVIRGACVLARVYEGFLVCFWGLPLVLL